MHNNNNSFKLLVQILNQKENIYFDVTLFNEFLFSAVSKRNSKFSLQILSVFNAEELIPGEGNEYSIDSSYSTE